MTNTFKLADIQDETRRRYAPVNIELGEDSSVELTALLRLDDKDRKAVLSTLDDIQTINDREDDAGAMTDDEYELLLDAIGGVLGIVSDGDAQKLLDAVADDENDVKLATLTSVLNLWIRGTQVGEAGNSSA